MPRPLPNPSAKRSRAGSKRRAAGWMLLTIGVLVAGIWAASGRQQVLVHFGSSSVAAFHGRLDIYQHWGDQAQFNKGYITERETHGWWMDWKNWWLWRWRQWSGFAPYDWTTAPLWPLPLLLWTTGGLALWSGRRARRGGRALEGDCPTCGYKLAGLGADAKCPECGGKAKVAT